MIPTTQQILERLISLGWSQSRIARSQNIPQPRLSRWLHGEVPGAADDALKLAHLLMQAEAVAAPRQEPRSPPASRRTRDKTDNHGA